MNRQERFEHIVYSMEPRAAQAELLAIGYTHREIRDCMYTAALKTGNKQVIKHIAKANLKAAIAGSI